MKNLILFLTLLMHLYVGLLEARAGDITPLTIGQLKYEGGNWNVRRESLAPFLNFLISRTSIEVDPQVRILSADSKEMFSSPFLLWIGDKEFTALPESGIQNLRRFLLFGGFLFIDNSQGNPGHGFDLSVRREIQKIFPANPLTRLAKDHTVYRSFYLLEKATGRLLVNQDLEGITIQGRTVLMYSQNDLLGAWSRDTFGNWEYEVAPGGTEQRKLAFRLGVNIVMYVLCDDYKKDSLHVEYILKRRRKP